MFFYTEKESERNYLYYLIQSVYEIIFLGYGQSNMGGKGLVASIPGGRPELSAALTGVQNWIHGSTEFQQMHAGVNTEASALFDFGPDLEFCYQMRQLLDAQSISKDLHFGKWFRGGTQLNQSSSEIDLHPYSTGETWDEFEERVEAIKADSVGRGKIPYFAGIIYFQGESDSDGTENANAYAQNLKELYNEINRITRVSGSYTPPPVFTAVKFYDIFAESPTVLAAIEDYPNFNPYAGYVEGGDAQEYDSQHPDATGLITIGGRLAAEMGSQLGI